LLHPPHACIHNLTTLHSNIVPVQIEAKSETLLSLNPWSNPFTDYDIYNSIDEKLLSSTADLHDSPDSSNSYYIDGYFDSYDYSGPYASEGFAKGAPGAPASAPRVRADAGSAAAPAAAAPPPPPDVGVCFA
jgi:hypothetical protein